MSAQTQSTQGGQNQTVFNTHRIYIKGSTIETPLTPMIFKEKHNPKVDMQVQTNYTTVEPNTYETVLSLQLTSQAEDKVYWRLQLQQAGIFTIENLPKDQLEMALHGFCMNLLYPYACSNISEMIVKSGFLPVFLMPMNFELLYREQQKKEAEKKQAEVKATEKA